MDPEDFQYVSDSVSHVGFFVESTDSYVRHALWKEHGFESASSGFGICIGGTAKTYVMFWFAHPKGRPERTFCFYEPTSELVHWGEVSDFINKLRGARGKCNASNFCHCVAWYEK